MQDRNLAGIGWLPFQVSQKVRAAESIYEFILSPANQGDHVPEISPGAHLDVKIGDHIRQYSIVGSSIDGHGYRVAVLREASGRGGSRVLCDDIQQGDVLQVRGPHNHFPLHNGDQPALLLAGGIGITPLLAMAAALSARQTAFSLHYCIQSRDRAAFLVDMNAADYRDDIHIHCDMEIDAGRPDLTTILSARRPDQHLYICGPGGFIDASVAIASELGWPADHVHLERFSAVQIPSTGDRPFKIEIASTGAIIEIPPGCSVAKALHTAGITIPLSCEEGVCGVCVTGVLAGIPEHRDHILTAEEHAANQLFTPCCSRSCTDTLVLDL